MIKRWLIAAAAITLALTDVRAQQLSTGSVLPVLRQLQLAAEALPAGERLPRLDAAIEWLGARAAKTNPADVSQEYLRSLQARPSSSAAGRARS